MSVTVFSDFPEKWEKFKRDVDRAAGLTMEEITKEVRSDIANRTPVLTGRAAASWNASRNTANITAKGEGYFNPTGAVADGVVDVEGARMGDVMYITNNVDYIEALNSGSSKKAPAGFVEAATLGIQIKMPEIIARVRAKMGMRGLL